MTMLRGLLFGFSQVLFKELAIPEFAAEVNRRGLCCHGSVISSRCCCMSSSAMPGSDFWTASSGLGFIMV